MSSTTGQQISSGNLIGIGLRLEILDLFASLIVHPLNWYAARLGYNKYSWALTIGPITLTQVDYKKYRKLLDEQQQSAAKELTKVLEKLEGVSESAKGKLKDLTKTQSESIPKTSVEKKK